MRSAERGTPFQEDDAYYVTQEKYSFSGRRDVRNAESSTPFQARSR